MSNSRSLLHLVDAKVWGGGEQYVFDVCRESARRGHRVFVALNKDRPEWIDRFREVAQVIPVRFHGPFSFTAAWTLTQVIRREHIEIIHNHSGRITYLARCLKQGTGAKLILFKHNVRPRKNDMIHRWLYWPVDYIVCVSREVLRMQTNGFSESGAKKYRLVYNGFSPDRFEPTTDHKKPGSRPFVVGYAGRLTEDKGLAVLLRAFARFHKRCPDSRLCLSGEPKENYDRTLHRLANELHINDVIIFDGFTRDMAQFYRKIDVLVLPSLIPEAFGLTLCEAMYCLTPVITTDSGAQKEIITSGENGFILPRGDESALEELLIRLFFDPQLSETIALAGRIRSEDFTIAKCVDGLEHLYTELIHS